MRIMNERIMNERLNNIRMNNSLYIYIMNERIRIKNPNNIHDRILQKCCLLRVQFLLSIC